MAILTISQQKTVTFFGLVLVLFFPPTVPHISCWSIVRLAVFFRIVFDAWMRQRPFISSVSPEIFANGSSNHAKKTTGDICMGYCKQRWTWTRDNFLRTNAISYLCFFLNLGISPLFTQKIGKNKLYGITKTNWKPNFDLLYTKTERMLDTD